MPRGPRRYLRDVPLSQSQPISRTSSGSCGSTGVGHGQETQFYVKFAEERTPWPVPLRALTQSQSMSQIFSGIPAHERVKLTGAQLTYVDIPLRETYKRSQWSAIPTSCACCLTQQCPPSSVQDAVTSTAFLRLTCCGCKVGKLHLHVHVSSSAHTWPMLWQAPRR